MKTLSSYKFKNNKEIRVDFLNRRDQKKMGVPECDNHMLVFEKSDEATRIGLRPDEMIILINLLSEALFKSVSAYELSILKGYNGFQK